MASRVRKRNPKPLVKKDTRPEKGTKVVHPTFGDGKVLKRIKYKGDSAIVCKFKGDERKRRILVWAFAQRVLQCR